MITLGIGGPRKDVPARIDREITEYIIDCYTLANLLKVELIIVTGGAPGVDTIADRAARSVKGAPEPWSLRPQVKGSGRIAFAKAAYARNIEVVEISNVFVSWWNGISRGTMQATTEAWKRGRLGEVHYYNGVVWTPRMSIHPIVYGAHMAQAMYTPSRFYYAALLLAQRIERTQTNKARQFGLSSHIDDALAWLGEHCQSGQLAGVEHLSDGALKFPSHSGKGDGHIVGIDQSCTCAAARHNRPCWARAAAWIVRWVEGAENLDMVGERLVQEHFLHDFVMETE